VYLQNGVYKRELTRLRANPFELKSWREGEGQVVSNRSQPVHPETWRLSDGHLGGSNGDVRTG